MATININTEKHLSISIDINDVAHNIISNAGFAYEPINPAVLYDLYNKYYPNGITNFEEYFNSDFYKNNIGRFYF